MKQIPIIFTIAVKDFDLNRLPEDARWPGSEAFMQAVIEYYAVEYGSQGYTAVIAVDDEKISVAAFPGQDLSPFDFCLKLLNAGGIAEVIPLLEILHRANLNDAEVAYNLGIAYSELGRYGEAVDALENAIHANPHHVNALVGLGFAYERLSESDRAEEYFRRAIALDPSNGWANRNLGGVLMKAGKGDEALPHLREAVHQLKDDSQSLFGLAQCLLMKGDDDSQTEADALLDRVIRRFPDHPIAEIAREERTRLANERLRANVGGNIRMDVVMYLLEAIKLFRDMPRTEIGQLTLEIAMLGRNGLDINNPSKTYHLKHLNADFTGLQLLSMMHVGVRSFDANVDTGADFEREYDVAKAMAGNGTN